MLATDAISTRKRDVLDRALTSEVVYQVWKGKYYTLPDYPALLQWLREASRPKAHEYVRKDQPVNLFFDIDYKHARLENEDRRNEILTHYTRNYSRSSRRLRALGALCCHHTPQRKRVFMLYTSCS